MKIHYKGCAVEEVLDTAEETTVVSVSDGIARKLDKLRDAHRCCQDAEAKYNLSLQIKELEGR